MPYFPPNQPAFHYLRHLQLMGMDSRQPLTEKELVYYVAHVNERGRPDGWFFDSFLPFASRIPSGNLLYNDINLGTTRSGEGDFFAVPSPNPGHKGDWEGMLESLFERDGFLARLQRCIGALKPRLGAPEHKHNVVVTIPYPSARQWCWGRLTARGPRLNFSVVQQNLMKATEQRLEACQWFVRETIARWEKAGLRDLHLLGFYWVYESLHYSWEVDDHWLLKEFYRFVRSKHLRLFWIPFYSSFNVHLLSDAPGFYFDACFLQPNHMFYYNIPDCAQAAADAKQRHAGIEIEYYLDIPAEFGVGREKYRRLRNYLNGGVEHGYMTESACAYFNGFNDLHKMAAHKNPREREAYHDLFHFVKGDYVPK